MRAHIRKPVLWCATLGGFSLSLMACSHSNASPTVDAGSSPGQGTVASDMPLPPMPTVSKPTSVSSSPPSTAVILGLDSKTAGAATVARDVIQKRTGVKVTSAQVFKTTRSQFAKLSGDTLTTNEDMVVLMARGSFVDHQASVPYGDGKTPVQPPSGSIAVVGLDANSNQVLDWGLMPAAPATSALGNSTDVTFPAS